MPKSKKSKRFKNKKFQDYNLSKISEHKSIGGKLQSGWNSMPTERQSVSWRDDGIPNYLWAIILIGNMERTECLELFRSIVRTSKNLGLKDFTITTIGLADISDNVKLKFFDAVLSNAKAKHFLSAISWLNCIPDNGFWRKYFDALSDDESIHILQKSIYKCFDHQSQESTDVRWLFLMYVACVKEKLKFPKENLDMIDNFNCYPNKGDMRSVRPSIRSAELMFRTPMFLEKEWDEVSEFNKQFWKECFDRTPCLVEKQPMPDNLEFHELRTETCQIYLTLTKNYSLDNSNFDAKRDVVYGIVLYAFNVFMNIISYQNARRIEGYSLLRTLVEIYINLKYLTHKNDDTLWKRFYEFGIGKCKQIFLKNIEFDDADIPDYLNMEEMYRYASENGWIEVQDIDLSDWCKSNLRTRATEAGIKDIYDKYYDYLSAFIHGHWGALRHTVFQICHNPMHKFHIVPRIEPNIWLESVHQDAGKIINLILELLNQNYPPFKQRITKHKNP